MHLEISCENRYHGWLINKYLNCSASQPIKPRFCTSILWVSLSTVLFHFQLLCKNLMGMACKMPYASDAMATAIAPKRQKFSLESLKAGDRVLKGIKDALRKKGEKIDYDKLRQDGYSEAMIERLKEL
jgi:hypothetical protein